MATPTDLPEWDTNDSNSAEPPQQYKDDGLPANVPLPYTYLNWMLGRIWLWIDWIKNTSGLPVFAAQHNPSTGAHTTITTSGNITAAGSVAGTALTAATGAVTAAAGVTAVTGNVTATAGDVVATAGNIAATAGSVSAGTTVAAGTTVTGGTGVVATTGDVVATAGDVIAGGDVFGTTDVTAGNGNLQATNGNVLAPLGTVAALNVTTKSAGMLTAAKRAACMAAGSGDKAAAATGSVPTAETALFDFVIPADTFTAGRAIRLSVGYDVSAYDGSATLQLRVRLGPTATALASREQLHLIDRATTEPDAGSSYAIDMTISVDTAGANAKGSAWGKEHINDIGKTGWSRAVVDRSGAGGWAGVDTTVEQTLSVTAIWSAAPSNGADLSGYTIELL